MRKKTYKQRFVDSQFLTLGFCGSTKTVYGFLWIHKSSWIIPETFVDPQLCDVPFCVSTILQLRKLWKHKLPRSCHIRKCNNYVLTFLSLRKIFRWTSHNSLTTRRGFLMWLSSNAPQRSARLPNAFAQWCFTCQKEGFFGSVTSVVKALAGRWNLYPTRRVAAIGEGQQSGWDLRSEWKHVLVHLYAYIQWAWRDSASCWHWNVRPSADGWLIGRMMQDPMANTRSSSNQGLIFLCVICEEHSLFGPHHAIECHIL